MTDNPQQPQYKPGDVANGHRLGEDNVWRPLNQPGPQGAAMGSEPATKAGFTGWMGRHKVLTGIAAFVLFALLVSPFMGGDDTAPASASAPTTASASTTEPTAEDFVMPSDKEVNALFDTVWEDDMVESSSSVIYLRNEAANQFGDGDGGKFETLAQSYFDEKVAAAERAEAEAKAAAEAKKKKAADARKAKIDGATAPSDRGMAKILKDPDAYAGRYFVVYGEITQFDSATGPDAFRADVANRNTTEYGFFDGENAIFTGTEKRLNDFVNGDVFKATVKVTGSLTYDTQIGGSTTVPEFEIIKITRIGNNG